MTKITAKIKERLIEGVKKFQTILISAKSKDINESDTVVIIADILNEILGYDKYSEITSEFSVKKTFCDLALRIDGKVKFLVEAKAIGLDLKNDHIRQALDYGANAGIEWIILTNGINWKIYKVTFGQPVSNELLYEIDLLKLNYKKDDDLELLFYLCKESLSKSCLEEFHMQKKILNKFSVGQIVLTDDVLNVIRKNIRKMSPEIKVTNEEIKNILLNEVLKREIFEGDKVGKVKRTINKLNKSYKRKLDAKAKKENNQIKTEKNETSSFIGKIETEIIKEK
ncbi:MAG TPA: restriction endonuclease subunit R [Bacteroidetes bacterium]|jgi:predicted type IV restriction endonuclease|nr:restriction endonuclease subunit R [Bacteroidota bacterium]